MGTLDEDFMRSARLRSADMLRAIADRVEQGGLRSIRMEWKADNGSGVETGLIDFDKNGALVNGTKGG